MQAIVRMTPSELAKSLRTDAKSVRRVLRDKFGTLEQQGRGTRWILDDHEAAYVRSVLG